MAFGAAAMAVGAPVRLTSSGVVGGGTPMARTYPGGPNNAPSVAETTALPSAILGFFVNSHTSGTLALSSNNAGAAGTAIGGTITFAAGPGSYSYPCLTPNGLFATIGGTADITFFVIE